MCLHFEAIESRRVVTRCNHHTACKLAAAHLKRNIRCGIGPVQHYHSKSVRAENLCGRACKGLRLKPHIETHEHGGFGALHGLEIVSGCLSDASDVFKGEFLGNDCPPAVGSKLDWIFHKNEKSVTTVLSPNTTPGLRFALRPI